uniref:Integrase catalytic domain-containing protein n=1 Tax=Meloidogyne hapla TaxID=6305 RepID=A0A1I8BIE4_MELHA
MEENNKILQQLYNNPKSPAAFSGVDRLWHEARKIIKGLPRSAVQNYLEGHRTYTLMRPKRIHFSRSKTIAAGFMTDVQVDLADFQALSRHNKGYRYLLLGIDVLSKRLFGVPVKAKKAEDMLEAFKLLLTQMPMKPHRIFSDKGLEFQFFEKEIQKIEPVHSTVKASLAERAIRNVKQRLYRYFSQNITLNWIDVLPKILEGINKAKCRVHGMRPIDVNFENAQEVWKKIYGEFDFKEGRPKFKEGENVRMSVGKGAFEKGYIPNWGDEILEVDQVYNRAKPIRYKVRDEKGEKFKGSFYGEELARVRKDADTEYRIEKVYRKRKRADGTYELLVKYIGYPEREWISESQLV